MILRPASQVLALRLKLSHQFAVLVTEISHQLTHIPCPSLKIFFFNYCFGIMSICHLCSSVPYRAEEGVIFPGDDVPDSCEPSGVGVGNLIPVL